MWGILTTLISLGIGILLYYNISQLQNWKTALLVVLLVALLLVSIYLLIVIQDTRRKRQKNCQSSQASGCDVVSTPARTPLTLSEWEASVSTKPVISKVQKKHISATVEEASMDASLFVRGMDKSAEQAQPEALTQPAVFIEDKAAVEMAEPSFKAYAVYDSANADLSASDAIYHLMDAIRPTGNAAFMPHNATQLQDVSVWEPEAASQGIAHSTENKASIAEGAEKATAENLPITDINVLGMDISNADIPDINVPDVDVPDANISDNDILIDDIPDLDVPDADISDNDVPDADVPDADVLDADVLDADIPDTGIPDGDMVTDTLDREVYSTEETMKQQINNDFPEPNGALSIDIAELSRLIGLKQFADAQNKIFHMLNSNHDLAAADKQQILLIMKLLKEKGK